jgi:hypothetical protein
VLLANVKVSPSNGYRQVAIQVIRKGGAVHGRNLIELVRHVSVRLRARRACEEAAVIGGNPGDLARVVAREIKRQGTRARERQDIEVIVGLVLPIDRAATACVYAPQTRRASSPRFRSRANQGSTN